MRTLYASDLDGTLLDSTARLSATTARILGELIDGGALFTFITARTPATVEPIMSRALPKISGVAMTGAALWNPSTRLYESVSYHRSSDTEIILDICHRHQVTPFIYTMPKGSNSLIVYNESPKLTPLEQKFVTDRTLNDLKTFKLYEPVPESAHDITILFFAMGEPDHIMAAAKEIHEKTDCYSSWFPDIYNPGVALLEVFTNGVSKAAGMKRLREMVKADKVIAFGDNLNDIPMLKAADVAVVVDNAHPDVKAVADIEIGPNTSDSVARFIAEDYYKGDTTTLKPL